MTITLGEISVVVNVVSAVFTLWAMQSVTRDANWDNSLGRIKWAHRAGLMVLSLMLLANAGQTLLDRTDPRWYDLAVEIMLMLVTFCSVLRHMFAIDLQAAQRGLKEKWGP